MIAKSLAVVTTLLTLATGGRAQDALPLSRTDRSIIPTQDQPEVQSSGFKKADHITGDWGGYRSHHGATPLFPAEITQLFAQA